MGDARVTLKPAGHVIGSAQVLIEVKGARVVVSGDYKRARDPTCPPFEPIAMRRLYHRSDIRLARVPPPAGRGRSRQTASLARAVPGARAFRRRLFARQGTAPDRVAARSGISTIRSSSTPPRRASAPSMPRTTSIWARSCRSTVRPRTLWPAKSSSPRPPRATCSPTRMPNPITSFASGWMRTRKRARAGGGELPLIISDHADWDELTQTAREIAPQRTLDHPRRGGRADPLGQDERHGRPPARDQRLRRRRVSRAMNRFAALIDRLATADDDMKHVLLADYLGTDARTRPHARRRHPGRRNSNRRRVKLALIRGLAEARLDPVLFALSLDLRRRHRRDDRASLAPATPREPGPVVERSDRGALDASAAANFPSASKPGSTPATRTAAGH